MSDFPRFGKIFGINNSHKGKQKTQKNFAQTPKTRIGKNLRKRKHQEEDIDLSIFELSVIRGSKNSFLIKKPTSVFQKDNQKSQKTESPLNLPEKINIPFVNKPFEEVCDTEENSLRYG